MAREPPVGVVIILNKVHYDLILKHDRTDGPDAWLKYGSHRGKGGRAERLFG